MATPECPDFDVSPPSSENTHSAALADIDRQLEATDQNENPIERFFQREKLLELKAEMQAKIDLNEQPDQLP